MHHEATIELVSLALDATVMRQTAIAQNVANANTDHYHAIDVSFEDQLNTLTSADQLIQPTYVQTDSPVKLDEQMAMSLQNATHYRALVKGLNHELAIMSLAVHGNQS